MGKITQKLEGIPQLKESPLQVSTVDAFQGAERNVIIVSCVRTRNIQRNEFVDSDKRINVAISRAKRFFFFSFFSFNCHIPFY